ncbi:bifunctional ADP-dependent NAD(P)H-hydrate dehydratase/NAD(P)H-hydrate epimerase [Acetobacter ghanensis]|uniref:Bifunctional NAD(P)H-hydrate repair enzyme n=1 Tax=Acetobacter ghanensis TaxID=431306 RepID=A0A0U5F8H0_9PROT|nr:bifunctional ADP-dependent NAD(P)H-hydrate dehydratase/NAD(P)H-hydrate epimerase [Acetobacter ghanensis]NHO39245.1 bifunctional ADP-dependent NAD(P)H-hydrate dehydratase/NAD(P)H-hydrate epimerase [Acetobacter ghanensis]GBQ45397.1 sugar kinase [Acetobacter ghanensis DSM 18895]CEF56565.1 carbohydrate kinase, YjeF related protein [Acetobacter ghanensis]
MQPRSPSSLSLYTPAQMGEVDRLSAVNVPVSVLMEHAGRAVARAIRRYEQPARVLVLCGPGNNGGDGYVAARYLAAMGWPVAVAELVPPKANTDAGRAAAAFTGPRVPFAPAEAARVDLVVDAVFGAGLSRDVTGLPVETLKAARRIVAIDIPSGLDGATGQVRGYAPQAAMTVTFCRYKPGHLLYPAHGLLGRLILADIGVPDAVLASVPANTWQNEPGLWKLPVLGAQSNKYTRGVVSICAGQSMPGATRLCASGARAAGAGLVRVAAGSAAPAYKLGQPGLIVDEAPLATLLEDQRRHVWVCGPGLTEAEVQDALPMLLESGRSVLADAGALTACTGQPDKLRGVSVITPHTGEFARVFGPVGANPPEQVRQAARQINAVVVLKGASTMIAAPDGRLAINIHATSALGTAGSGDTLSGVIAALLAAGMPAWEAACAGVWLHGEAGLQSGPWPVAEDLDCHLGQARQKAEQAQG